MRILVAVDVNDRAEQVVDHAVAWAHRLGGRLHLAFASEWSTEGLPKPPFPTDELDRLWASWSERAADEQQRLRALEARVPEDLRGSVQMHSGRPVDVLPDLAREHDLLIVATHSRSGLERVVLGSVTARLVRRAACPVLVVGLGDPPVASEGPIDVLAPVDDEDACALPWIRDHFATDGARPARVQIVHVTPPELPALLAGLEPPGDKLVRQRQVAQRLQELAAEHGFVGATLHLVPRQTSNPGDAIAEVAHAVGADLIVLPTHGRTGLDHLLLGSVAERVVDRAPSPVLVVPKTLISGRRAADFD